MMWISWPVSPVSRIITWMKTGTNATTHTPNTRCSHNASDTGFDENTVFRFIEPLNFCQMHNDQIYTIFHWKWPDDKMTFLTPSASTFQICNRYMWRRLLFIYWWLRNHKNRTIYIYRKATKKKWINIILYSHQLYSIFGIFRVYSVYVYCGRIILSEIHVITGLDIFSCIDIH